MHDAISWLEGLARLRSGAAIRRDTVSVVYFEARHGVVGAEVKDIKESGGKERTHGRGFVD